MVERFVYFTGWKKIHMIAPIHIKRSLALLVIKKTQIKSSVRYHFTHTGMSEIIFFKSWKNVRWGETDACIFC